MIILDTNVYLNIYRYSPEFTEFALKCLNSIKESIVISETIKIEFLKHCKTEYFKMRKRVERAQEAIRSQVNSSKQKISNSCDDLALMQYPDIQELDELLQEQLTEIENTIEDFFMTGL
ncbi:PIN domain-containing protein [Clostridium algidicarnis]|nr:PIN domain-containing protein [Clostridium algidicarnis]